MKLVVGLGNPGKKYEATRHNAGFMAVDALAEHMGITFTTKSKHKALVAQGFLDGEKVLLVKPQTFMNLSGDAVISLMDYYNIPLEDLVVLVDDITLSPGTIRIRGKGSSGGQNGIKHIIHQLGSQEFKRIKIGTGRNDGRDTISHVLGGFSDEEWKEVAPAIERAAQAVSAIFREGLDMAMNRYNG